MTLRDALAVLLVIAMWLAVFVPLLLEAWRLRCGSAANGKCGIPRKELQAKFEPRLKVLMPLFWVGAGVLSGYVADHPIPVAAAVLFIRLLFFLVAGSKRLRIGTLLLHVVEFATGTALGIWIHKAVVP